MRASRALGEMVSRIRFTNRHTDERATPLRRRASLHDSRKMRKARFPNPEPPNMTPGKSGAVMDWALYYAKQHAARQQPAAQDVESPETQEIEEAAESSAEETPLRYADLLLALQKRVARASAAERGEEVHQQQQQQGMHRSIFVDDEPPGDINWSRAQTVPERGSLDPSAVLEAQKRQQREQQQQQQDPPDDGFFKSRPHPEAGLHAEAPEGGKAERDVALEEEGEREADFPSPTTGVEAAARVGREEALAMLGSKGCPHPLMLLEGVTAAGCRLEDAALAEVLSQIAGELAAWGAARQQDERYRLGIGVLKKIEGLCEGHDAGVVSASGLLLCAACIPLPVKSRALFASFVDDGIRLTSKACNTYLKSLIAFGMKVEARHDAKKCLQSGAELDHEVYKILLAKNRSQTSKQNLRYDRKRRIESRMRGFDRDVIC